MRLIFERFLIGNLENSYLRFRIRGFYIKFGEKLGFIFSGGGNREMDRYGKRLKEGMRGL